MNDQPKACAGCHYFEQWNKQKCVCRCLKSNSPLWIQPADGICKYYKEKARGEE